jgi:gamma-glutamylcyclotransferase (GGCT)/AIG2-like uncharacterized protein YtfP
VGDVLAVYGTLRAGQPNWQHLLASSPHLGSDEIAGFGLLTNGRYPYAVADPEGRIVVDLFEVDAATLKLCDHLEKHPEHYRRIRVSTRRGTDAWLYAIEPERAIGIPIPDGDWLPWAPVHPPLTAGIRLRLLADAAEGRGNRLSVIREAGDATPIVVKRRHHGEWHLYLDTVDRDGGSLLQPLTVGPSPEERDVENWLARRTAVNAEFWVVEITSAEQP